MHVKKIEVGPEKYFKFKMRCARFDDMEVTASTHQDVDYLKSEFGKKFEVKTENVRLFYNGKEMVCGYQIGNFKVDQDCVVQVFCSS